jgi:hypothetical protein
MLLLPANPRLPDIYSERACGRRYPGVRELFVPSISARAIAAEGLHHAHYMVAILATGHRNRSHPLADQRKQLASAAIWRSVREFSRRSR